MNSCISTRVAETRTGCSHTAAGDCSDMRHRQMDTYVGTLARSTGNVFMKHSPNDGKNIRSSVTVASHILHTWRQKRLATCLTLLVSISVIHEINIPVSTSWTGAKIPREKKKNIEKLDQKHFDGRSHDAPVNPTPRRGSAREAKQSPCVSPRDCPLTHARTSS